MNDLIIINVVLFYLESKSVYKYCTIMFNILFKSLVNS